MWLTFLGRVMTATLAVFVGCSAASATQKETPAEQTWVVGVAAVDITPGFPVRLSGFGFRRTESEGVRQRISAKAIAFGADDDHRAVLITVDNLGVPDRLTAEVAARLKNKVGLEREQLAITSSHTHTAPMLTGVAPTLFGMPIPAEHQQHINAYTSELTDNLEQVALAALKDRQPAKLSWGIGKVELAINRRMQGGPVDHDLPLLVVSDLRGGIRAIYVNYACHCVTLSDNQISGDWAGYVQEHIERRHPGAIALISIGCGADSNPRSGVTGAKGEIAEAQGVEIASEVDRLLKGPLQALTRPLVIDFKRINLPFDKLPTREEYAEKAKSQDAIGFHARTQLARLDRGESLRDKISYPVQTWAFGESLAIVFLSGEVVVDYALRLKRELDGRRLWINSYANDVPCYIPSERILKEGGYEGGGAMVYYDQPTKLAAGLEKAIVDAVVSQIGEKFRAPVISVGSQKVPPLSPDQSLAALQTKPGLMAELMAAEPLVASPVAIDFGPDGKLWVAEMADYPMGADGNYQPGGRIRVLESTHDDGFFDKATVFLEGIPFPTGVTVWRQGILVCAAPDILYAEDTNGDGKADRIRKLFSGFGIDNYQARVNSLEYGLDGWVYGSCGLFGGVITNDAGQPAVALGDRDFRIKPDSGIIEPATGRTQQGRVRDDWGNWFGCDNSNLCRHYPLADEYLRRNPYFAPQAVSVSVPEGPDPNRLFPLQTQLQLFKLSGPPGRTTAACGLGIYRDDLLGDDFRGNSFTCEPVSLIVHRLQLVPKKFSFAGRRAADELDSEFLASTDLWFRPVQARTGPDGALWIVDMHRQVIEHPRWIPPEDLAKIDVRAGQDMGRIYRIRPSHKNPRKWQRLDILDTAGLVAALDSPNGWQRDMSAQMLYWKNDTAAAKPLAALGVKSPRPETRLATLCVLDRLDSINSDLLVAALADVDRGIRRHALRLTERFVNDDARLGMAMLQKLDDSDAQVALQLACSLGAWRDSRAGRGLANLLTRYVNDPLMTAAVFSSLQAKTIAPVISEVLRQVDREHLSPLLLERLFEVAASLGDKSALPEIIAEVAQPRDGHFDDWQLTALAGVYSALERRQESPEKLVGESLRKKIHAVLATAQKEAADTTRPEARRIAAVSLLARESGQREADGPLLQELLAPGNTPALQAAAAVALGRLGDDRAAESLTANWRTYTPALKSRVLEILLSRDTWQWHLLQSVPGMEIDATRRQRLLTSRHARIRKLAEERFAGAASPDRKKVLDEYRDVATLRGDHQRGQAVFTKTCSVCHEIGVIGHAVGPDLGAVANKTPQYLLQEILDPNRNVDSRYVSYVAVTTSGRTFTGLLASETAGSLTLKGAEGKEEVILRADLEELQSTSMSLMPIGLEKDLTKQDLADLLAYLAAIGLPPKPFDGNAPEILRPANGAIALLATAAEIYGDQIAFETTFRNIGYWHGANDHVVWTVELDHSEQFDVWLDWACDDSVAGNKFVMMVASEELHGTVGGTGGWNKFQQKKVGTLALPAGTLRVSLRPEGNGVLGALMDLRGVYLVPPGKSPQLAAAPSAKYNDNLPPDGDPAITARQILEDSRSDKEREELIHTHLDQAAELVAAMTVDLAPEPKEEYRRIPWIWRVAIAAGKKNDAKILRKLLDVTLPRGAEPLRDWQAVVVGGGIINGMSQQGLWPAECLNKLLHREPELTRRWRATLALAAAMADNEKVSVGTRYDALRIISLQGWKLRGVQLTKYLQKGIDEELQMGAISGASDVDIPEVGQVLAAGLNYYSPDNRALAIDALLRTESRTIELIEALEKKQIKPTALNAAQIAALQKLKNKKLSERVTKVLAP